MQASFASKNDETLKSLQMQLEQNKSFEIEQMRMQFEAQIKELEEKAVENTQTTLWEEKEQKMREEMQISQQKQQEEMLNMQKTLMEAIKNQ